MTDDAARRTYQLLVISMWADGESHEAEQQVLRSLLQTAALSPAAPDVDRLSREARETLDRAGLAGAVAEIAGGLRDREAQEHAFACCAQVLEADRAIARQEFQVLARLRAVFDFSAADVARLLRR